MKLPSQPFHPGEFLFRKFLAPSNMSQADFARKMGWRKERLNKLIKARCGVTAEAALDLAEALGTSAEFWLRLQAEFDLAIAVRRRNTALW
ncbi:MAG TPA: HigA family addiction module antitoxin [Steroidobacteraceae bacterium]|jgi:addiction module HigA family antidote|nr:HigA family addiction module antitoxin [Steroidobacteraceae bacterium]